MTMTASGSSGFTFPDGSTQATAGFVPFRNRIINGDMRLNQRGASVTANTSTSGTYITDRFREVVTAGTGVFTVAQDTSAPAGFSNSLKATVTTAYSVSGTDRYEISQLVEGYNIADLAWGTASASPITLSFWVRSSLTGAFGGVVQNADANYNYPFSYTITAANTWEQKTITVSGATSGTWATDNSQGLKVTWSLGCGSTRLGTAGAWSSTRYEGAIGQTQVVGTVGATFYITGVQLEKGSTATSFDYRPYGSELALCQRYYYKESGAGGYAYVGTTAWVRTNNTFVANQKAPVTMRSTPTGGSLGAWYAGDNSATNYQIGTSSVTVSGTTATSANIDWSGISGGSFNAGGATAPNAGPSNTGGFYLSAEL